VNENRTVSLEDEEAHGLRRYGCQASRVVNLGAGDDQVHGRRGPYCPFRTVFTVLATRY
jgi:hypothetical protein